MSKSEFFRRYGQGQAKLIGKDQSKYSDGKSITSYDIGDCITVFAIEKKQGKAVAILGWHIANHSSIEDIKAELDEHGVASNYHEIYIVGGTADTTEGTGCLLDNIHQALDQYFTTKVKIAQELVDLVGGECTFVSANLQLNGTLTICRHDNRHD